MNMRATASPLAAELKAHTGRFTDKEFDWNAFPSNAGFPDLARAQMRYVGAGGSPKVGDTSTLKADNFTVSLIYKEPGKYAACHSHEIEESFLIIDGALIVGWERDGEVCEVNLGPKDMILNAREIGHGFRVDGVEPVLMSISVDVGKPLPPVYHYHPKEHAPELARAFGAKPGETIKFDPAGDHPLQKLMAQYVIRHVDQPTIWEDAGFSRKVYVGEGGLGHDTCRKEMWGVPSRVGIKGFVRDVEDAFLVLEGSLTVGWEDNGETVEVELGPRDLVKTPAGRKHWIRNDGAGAATVWHVIGSSKGDDVVYEAA
ncbi:MAG: cupin domain-containing protein [Marinovum algicola]|uniref:Cupin domain-containing protein n=1 Tax=Marinovum algicola TaxID=42444 RepID=A0A975WD51_9RHOB|nr:MULTISPECIES: cupin domain-containing protein [Marinovum]AKO99915.1 Cupin domain protein [Marinovum algicola DG 898]MDD9739421.1 cupin domain-containing protein [Marinovum sp. SP66]MDD9744893.1 cupin domain-containing protein [Marinovum sp. PR37]SEJ98246.1 Cupin domain-containing protein [Marinovum algicola]SLN70334.1 Acireductone dioxygenase [Marinovum algicola]